MIPVIKGKGQESRTASRGHCRPSLGIDQAKSSVLKWPGLKAIMMTILTFDL